MRAVLLAGCILVVVAAAGCGGGDERPAAAPAPSGTRLEVTVRPKGTDGPVRRRVVTRLPRGVAAEDFTPADPAMACTEIYGGPATARVTGTLAGEPVEASFARTDGCEIARWDEVAALLGRVPGVRAP